MQLKRKRRGRASLSVSVIKLGTKLERLCGFLFVVYPFIYFFFSIIAPCETNYARQNKRGDIYLSNCHVGRLKTPGRRAWGLTLKNQLKVYVWIWRLSVVKLRSSLEGGKKAHCNGTKFIFKWFIFSSCKYIADTFYCRFLIGTSCDVRKIMEL